MSDFSILIQRNKSEKNKIGKNIETIASVSGVLREGSSIINPVISLQIDPVIIRDSNYITIEEFKRSYFISNITYERRDIVSLTLTVDPLESFKDEIKANTAKIKRQENNFNLYLQDDELMTYQNTQRQFKKFPNALNNPSLILAIAG